MKRFYFLMGEGNDRIEDPEGEYMLVEDHEEIVAALKQTIEALKAKEKS